MYGEMTTARKKNEEEEEEEEESDKKSNHTLFADNSIFRQMGVKNSEINRLRKKNKIIMISAKETTKLHDKRKEENSTCLNVVFL